MEPKWVQKYLYGLQQCVKWYSWSILIILYALYSERGPGCNAHNCFAIACSYLTMRPPFLTCDECSQSVWRSICMGTSSVSNGIASLNGSYVLPSSWKEAVAAMIKIILLLHVHIWHRGHHLSLVIIGVKVTEAVYVCVPAVCQMVELVYIDHTLCPVFRKRLLLQCPKIFCCCCNAHNYFAIACSYLTPRPSVVTGN
jgi:hypothetical protein